MGCLSFGLFAQVVSKRPRYLKERLATGRLRSWRPHEAAVPSPIMPCHGDCRRHGSAVTLSDQREIQP
jgi:hypothetical protein